MSAQRDADCLFCKIVEGEIPADLVHETENTIAFRDIEPQAPTHVLVIPRNHHENVVSLVADEPETTSELVEAAAAVADREGLEGFRLVFNTGRVAGQLVMHTHAHVLGGRPLRWPPG